MQRAIENTIVLVVPQEEHFGTSNLESVREPGVIAVALDPTIDRDGNGVPDADNDGDGRIDEDFPRDANNDDAPGIRGVDDDNNGITDVALFGNRDDDETRNSISGDEDPINGLDDDGDDAIDEDPPADMNGDGAPGIAGVDDDGDGTIDEGSANDDDEDGLVDEDWLDTVVFRLIGTNLFERTPVPWDQNQSGSITGRDYVEQIIAENVTSFVVRRIASPEGGLPIVEIDLVLTQANGNTVARTVKFLVGSNR